MNGFLISIRTLKRQWKSTLPNLISLTAGFIGAVFILLWIYDEYEVNKFLKDKHTTVAKVLVNIDEGTGQIDTWEYTPFPLKLAFENYPFIEKIGVSTSPRKYKLLSDDKEHTLVGCYGTDGILSIFQRNVLAGVYPSGYEHEIAISEDALVQLFGSETLPIDALNKKIEIKGYTFIVQCVFESFPDRSSFKTDLIMSYERLLTLDPDLDYWHRYANLMFVQIPSSKSVNEANKELHNLISTYSPVKEDLSQIMLQEFADSYLYDAYEQGKVSGGRIRYLRLLGMAAFLLSILAVVNAVNLMTLSYIKDSRFVSYKKLLGASSFRIYSEILRKAFTLTSSAALLTFVFVVLARGLYFNVTNKQLDLFSLNWTFWMLLAIAILIVSIIISAYPYITTKVIDPFNANVKIKVSDVGWLQSILVSVQYLLTFTLIIFAIVVNRQTNYSLSKDLGVDMTNVFYIKNTDVKPSSYKTLCDKIKQLDGVVSVSSVDEIPTNIHSVTYGLEWDSRVDSDNDIYFNTMLADHSLLQTLQIGLVAGRNFNHLLASDSTSFIINQKAQEVMGLTDPLDKPLFWDIQGKIIGVVKDYHLKSLHSPIEPLIIGYKSILPYTLIKLESNYSANTLDLISKEFNDFTGNNPIINSLESQQQALYQTEITIKKLTSFFVIVAVLLSYIGQLGLITHRVYSRQKEIAIRKVHGASQGQVISLFLKGIFVLIGIGVLIGIPISIWISNSWLENFAYHIDFNFLNYFFVFLLLCLVSFISIVRQVFFVSSKNPSTILNQE